MKRFVFAAGALLTLSSGALAWSDQDRSELALALGSVLAAEEPCGLTYSQSAIETYIAENVPAEDIHFGPQLWVLTGGSKQWLADMSKSQVTAHCAHTRRVAAEYGFVSDTD